jgi:hypothetical protein
MRKLVEGSMLSQESIRLRTEHIPGWDIEFDDVQGRARKFSTIPAQYIFNPATLPEFMEYAKPKYGVCVFGISWQRQGVSSVAMEKLNIAVEC